MMISADIGVMPNEKTVADLLCGLEHEDYQAAVSFIGYLSAMRKKKKAEDSRKILAEIQNMFSDDKGWNSEQDMIEDMAKFRRERSGL
ncbi:hypothetical protein [Selenomonas sp. KH1T6]|uniref:hypothetical protein n=1 Tax=Selenomonas sp. KH1T6 TaxID=3158784 RepID=UPI0008A728BA|nr:hypothetical protein SAMN05216583_103153 [Selenomonas ruminantium]